MFGASPTTRSLETNQYLAWTGIFFELISCFARYLVSQDYSSGALLPTSASAHGDLKMLSMKSVAAALLLVASAADLAVPVLIAPALVLGASTLVRAAPAMPQPGVKASKSSHYA